MSNHESPDKLFDTSPEHLAAVFGRRCLQLMRDGRDPYQAARLAAFYAQQVIAAQPKVIGRISESEPWGVSEAQCLVSNGDYRQHWPGER